MTETKAPGAEPIGRDRWFAWVLAGLGILTALRLATVFLSPIELYPDEAQYWLWSRTPAFGYFSKPPLVAWLIALSTAVGGDGEAWVRLPAVVVHAVATLVQYRIGLRLFGPRQGAVSALLYALMPGVVLSSSVIATDAPLLLFISAALLAYVEMWRAENEGARRRAAVGLGIALGLAFLSKYAAIYFVIGLGLHAVVSRRARGLWGAAELGWGLGLTALLLAPNLVWNAAHDFPTLVHTVANTGVQDRIGRWSPKGAIDYLLGQLSVFGPVPLLALILGAAVRSRRLSEADLMLGALIAPPLLIVLVEAIVARANANWAAVAYVAACPLLAGWLVERRAWAVLGLAALSQTTFLILFTAGAVHPALADRVGAGASLRRARGRTAEVAVIRRELALAQARGAISAVAVDRRFEFNTLAYYGRDLFGRGGAPPLRMWVRESRPHNQAEMDSPLRRGPEGRRVLFVDYVPSFTPEARADFTAAGPSRPLSVPLDRKRVRVFTSFVGVDLQPRPRDPVSGRPTPP